VKAAEDKPSAGKPFSYAATVLFIAAIAIILGTGAYYVAYSSSPGYSSGGAAAAVGVLLIVGLLLQFPTLLMDAAPEEGGAPSTMRVMTLSIIITFCVLMLRTGWNLNQLPSLKDQPEWVWLVTAALGGKALQSFAENQSQGGGKKP
jgi:hypothetical protein